jgi:hypothetical protein
MTLRNELRHDESQMKRHMGMYVRLTDNGTLHT